MVSRSASADTAARAADNRAAATGSLSAQARGGGGPVTGCPGAGSCDSLSAFARSTAACHCSSCRRPIRCPNPLSAARACTLAGMDSEASTMAASDSTLPGDTSRFWAIRSRVCHSSRTTASCRRLRTLCIPDVRRQGSLRGSAGGADAIASNSCRAHSSFPCRSSSFSSASRRSTSSSTSRAAYRSHGSGSGRVDQSTAECPFSRTNPSTLSTIAPSPTLGNPASRPASSVSNSRVGTMPISRRQGRSWVAACSTHSTPDSASPSPDRSGHATGSISAEPAPSRRSCTR